MHDVLAPGARIFEPYVQGLRRGQLGIDQGPIVLMLENYRTGLVWDVMRKSDVIARGLCKAGFTGGWLEGLSE